MPYKDPQKAKEYKKKMIIRLRKNPIWLAKKHIQYKKDNKIAWEKLKKNPVKMEIKMTKSREYQREWIKRPYIKEKRKQYAWNRRMKCLIAYGGKIPKCKCCGLTEPKFLCLDHTNGGGTSHRKTVGSTSAFYCWLIRNKFPKNIGIQVLCHNCNMAKGFYGKCPHKEKNL